MTDNEPSQAEIRRELKRLRSDLAVKERERDVAARLEERFRLAASDAYLEYLAEEDDAKKKIKKERWLDLEKTAKEWLAKLIKLNNEVRSLEARIRDLEAKLRSAPSTEESGSQFKITPDQRDPVEYKRPELDFHNQAQRETTDPLDRPRFDLSAMKKRAASALDAYTASDPANSLDRLNPISRPVAQTEVTPDQLLAQTETSYSEPTPIASSVAPPLPTPEISNSIPDIGFGNLDAGFDLPEADIPSEPAPITVDGMPEDWTKMGDYYPLPMNPTFRDQRYHMAWKYKDK